MPTVTRGRSAVQAPGCVSSPCRAAADTGIPPAPAAHTPPPHNPARTSPHRPARSAQSGSPTPTDPAGRAPSEDSRADVAETGLPVREPRGQLDWIRSLAIEPWVQQLQRRTRDRLLTMARELMLHADWTTYETWPTWERLIAATRWARSTMAGWLRHLRLTGWLVLLETGSTPTYRPMGSPEHGNRAAVYALRIPHPDQQPSTIADPDTTPPGTAGAHTWTPTKIFDLTSSAKKVVLSRARKLAHRRESLSVNTEASEALRASIEEKSSTYFDDQVPVGRFQMLVAATELQNSHPVTRRLSRRKIRQVCRPFWHAGWTNTDVLHALRWSPDSWIPRTALAADQMIAPARWIEARLGAWRTDDGGIQRSQRERDRDRDLVREQFGHAASLALPHDATRLTPQHVLTWARQFTDEARALIREAISRRAAAEAHQPAGHPSASEVGSDGRTDVQRRIVTQARAALAAHKKEAATGSPRDTTTRTTFWAPEAPVLPNEPTSPEQRLQLARDRGRYERSLRRR